MGLKDNQINDKNHLTGRDYMTKDLIDLKSHPDFSSHAKRIIEAIAVMNTDQLEQLDILRGK